MIQESDLIYYGKVMGKKPHLIYKQRDIYILLSEMEHGTRGNFSVIHQTEVDKVTNDLRNNLSIPTTFHCDNIYGYVHGMNIDANSSEPEFLINRLRNICYILVKNGLLDIQKDGNSIWFRKTESLKIKVETKSLSNVKLNGEPLYQPKNRPVATSQPVNKPTIANSKSEGICPYCGVRVSRAKYDSHVQSRCPKRKFIVR
jgi:hypothetical protein